MKSAMLIILLMHRKVTVRAVQRYFDYKGEDIEEFLVSKMRGFPVEVSEWITKYRIKPHAPLLAFIYRRTSTCTAHDHENHIKNFKYLDQELRANGFFVPGQALKDRSYWLFPVPTPN